MIPKKTKGDIEVMKQGGAILSFMLEEISKNVAPGIKTLDLNKKAEELIEEQNKKGEHVEASFYKYNNYPAKLCISVNDEVVHGVPSERILENGDVIGIDFGLKYKGFHIDSAVTVIAGDSSHDKNKLLSVTQEALSKGIAQAKIGNTVGDIGYAIQKVVEQNNFSVVRDLVGHGVGRELHEEPQIPNFGTAGEGPKLEEGMVLAIEPMVTDGDWRVKLGEDGLTYKTKDGSISAHFEHTVAVTNEGPLVLTR